MISENIKNLKSGEAIHVGHSYVVLNISGIKIALDACTDNGYCISTFTNLLKNGKSYIRNLPPIINPQISVPNSSDLAKSVDFVFYSHIHPDHFNRTLVEKVIGINNKIKIVCPYGTNTVLSHHPKQDRATKRFIKFLKNLNILRDQIDGILEYLESKGDNTIPSQNYIELSEGEEQIISQNPFIKVESFELRHPKPQLYVRLPFEPKKLPPTLGYLITYEENGYTKKVILVGETGNAPELLWQIWKNREELVAVFVPVADEATTKGLKWYKDTYVHASLLILSLAEQLTTDKCTIHALHQGLWYYSLDANRIKISRQMLDGKKFLKVSKLEFEDIMLKNRKYRHLSFRSYFYFEKLLSAIRSLSLAKTGQVKLSVVGSIFKFGN